MQSPVYLTNGYLIKDYFNTSQNDFKLYIFTTKSYPDNSDKGLIVTLTYETFQYNLYVYNDKNMIYYNSETNKMESALWSGTDGQIEISSKDPKFVKGSNYYIVVVLKDYFMNKDYGATMGKYYISAVFEDSSLILFDGVVNMFTLNHQKNQTYLYLHSLVPTDVFINADVFFGDIKLYANVGQLITANNTAKYKAPQKVLESIHIPLKDMERCNNLFFCVVHILVEKVTDGSQYVIGVESGDAKPKLFKQGVISSNRVLPDMTKYHYTIVHKDDQGIINVDFKHGRASLYGMLLTKEEDLKSFQHDWPKPNRFTNNIDISSNQIGFNIKIKPELIKNCNPCIIILALTGESLNPNDLDIVYSISYTSPSSAIRITMNHPYKSVIESKEYNYYQFHFPRDISTLYVQLTNVHGDSDLIMNYGPELPTLSNYHWRSASSISDIIDINLNDNFFTDRKIQSMQGIYTVGVVGYTASTYVLYVTSHLKRIQYVRNDVSASCMTKVDNDWCYFRYETGWTRDSDGNELEIENLLVNTEYSFGTGLIVAKVMDTSKDDVFDQLPTRTEYEWSSEKQNTRDYLFMEVPKNRLLKKHEYLDILIGVLCIKRCFFTITPATQYFVDERWIEHGRENLIYMEPNKSLTLKYFNSKHESMIITMKSFMGSADVGITEHKLTANSFATTSVTTFTLSEAKPFQKIDYKPKMQYFADDKSHLLTTITTSAENAGFYYQIEDLQELKQFKMMLNNEIFFMEDSHVSKGYFEVLQEYEAIIVNLSPRNVSRLDHTDMKIYAKLKIVDKNKFYEDPKADAPHENDFDYHDSYDPTLNRFHMRLPGVKFTDEVGALNNKTQIAIYMITIECYQMTAKMPPFDLSLIPVIDQVMRYNLSPGKAIFSTVDVSLQSYHIYDLGKHKNKDNVLELQVSECNGKVDFKFTNQVVFIDSDTVHSIPNIQYKNGRYVALLSDISNNYFLTVKGLSGRPKINNCFYDVFKKYTCFKTDKVVADYMVYFDTYEKDNYFTYEPKKEGIIEYEISSSDTVTITWPGLQKRYINNGETSFEDTEAEYNIYLTDDEEISKQMQSLCSLEYSDKISKVELNIKKNTYEIRGLQKNRKYFINIVALPKSANGLTYIPVEIEIKGSWSLILTISVLVVILVMGGVAVYSYKKLKRTENLLELTTGMKSDAFVGNLSLTEMSSQRNLRYGTLVEEGISSTSREEAVDK